MRFAPVHRGRRGTKIFLCVWHVKRAWLKNLQKKVASWPVRNQMLTELTAILESREEKAAKELVAAFLAKWVRLLGWDSGGGEGEGHEERGGGDAQRDVHVTSWGKE